MKFMKLKAVMSLLLALLLAVSFAGCGEQEDERVLLNITTATTGGTYYPMGVGMATLWTDHLRAEQGITVSAQSSAGSVENVDILRGREADLAIMQGLIGAMAWEGSGPFEGKPNKDLRAITSL